MCGKPITKKRFRTYCSKKCRNRRNNVKYHSATKEIRDRSNKRQRIRLDRINKESGKELIQCKICNRWFRQVGSHVYNYHKITAREYREYIGADVKKGILPDDLRKLYCDQAKKNETYKNVIDKGVKYRFKKGDPRAGKYRRSEETMERLRSNADILRKAKK